jgi:uncharacterized protein (UPF0335 family)
MGRKRKPKDDHPKIGHNGGQVTDENQRKLKGYVAEIERIGAQLDELKAEQKLIFDSAKDSNFDVKAIRAIVKERRVDKAKRRAFESVMDAYRHALGMLADTPLGEAAMKRDLPTAA